MITAYSLGLGGIEKALINLLQLLNKEKYEITLVLEKKEGIFLEQLPNEIEVVEYHVHDDKNPLIRKIKNRFQLLTWKMRHKNQYDFAISFTTYSRPGAHIALNASRHNALWIHNNYEQIYEGDVSKIKEFFQVIQAKKFQHLVFVSHDNLEAVCKYIPQFKKKSFVCNNIIDYKTMWESAKKEISISKKKVTFLNVGRHEEHQKRLSRIIESCDRLVQEKYDFQVWFLGEGVDTKRYLQMVSDKGLEDVILFLGKKENPFPYYEACDCVLLSSQYEGYPVVFVEAMTMGRPLVTTKVSDYREVEDAFGIVIENSEEGVYQGMREFLDHGYHLEAKFDPEQFNQDILGKLNQLIEGDFYEKKD